MKKKTEGDMDKDVVELLAVNMLLALTDVSGHVIFAQISFRK